MSEEEAGFSCHVLFVLSLILITGRVIAEVPPLTDKEVVLKLKHFLQSRNPVNQGGYAKWNESDPSPCGWAGITCNGNGRVTRVDLSASDISGGLFDGFSLLGELTSLDLSANTICGAIPRDLNQCTNLRYLNLSHNLIDGELNLTGLTNLETLDLTVNRFEGGIGASFPAICKNLVTLNISANNFTGHIRDSFDQCPRLKYLDLSTNRFTGELWQGFAGLREFSAAENNLTGGISSSAFTSDCELQVLDLSANHLSGWLPNSIANCSKLTFVNLWRNNFTGRLPPGIGLLPELGTLFLGGNRLDRDIPQEMLNCTKLLFLDLSENNFGGEIQNIFGRFVSVQFLALRSNSYTGGIESSGIVSLRNLTRLDLSYNNFSGSLPVRMANLPNLKFLILACNKFSGSIPPEYGDITGLQALDLSFNQLTGDIPPKIGFLKSLLWLMLANNRLTGGIPPEIGNCSSLLWLNLENNQLSGKIPPEIAGTGSDPYPTFEANRRDGAVIAVAGECFSMKRWIPATYPPFSFMYTLLTGKNCRITWNRILKGSGIFPICLNSSSPVQTLGIAGYLELSGNRISGEIPPEIGSMGNLSLVHVMENRLSGRLPSAIARLPLVDFNASGNELSGEIPPELGRVRCLRSLDLSRNNFSGAIPASLNDLTELSAFNVSFNPLLAGAVPVTGQISTFDGASFLGDPLITFSSTPATGGPPPAIAGRGRSSGPAFWACLVVTAAFFSAGLLSCAHCLGIRAPMDPTQGPDADDIILDGVKRRSDVEGSSQSASTSSWSSPADGVRVFRLDKTAFTYGDIVTATGNFSDDMVIGRGGFGVVYHGVLPDGRHVAVKKLERGRREGDEGAEREFRAEMEVMACRPHPNLVRLFGWCLSGSAKLLVYEYMEGGSLEELIGDWTRFGWESRLETAIGVARALVYLHHECRPAVVHRDVKASNVLLDREGRARVTDFGLSRIVGLGESHVSTVVAGTVGYVAPEYGHMWRATTRGDVYSFGVVALELATGRRAVEAGEEECLVEWVRRVAAREGRRGLRRAVVPVVVPVEEEGLVAMWWLLAVGMRCTVEAPQARPDMREVLALLLKISGTKCGDGESDGRSP